MERFFQLMIVSSWAWHMMSGEDEEVRRKQKTEFVELSMED